MSINFVQQNLPYGDWITAISKDGNVCVAADEIHTCKIYVKVGSGAWIERKICSESSGWECLTINEDGTYIWAGEWNGRLWKSVDYGETWTEVQPANENADFEWMDLSVSDDGRIVMATQDTSETPCTYYSIDYGVSWQLFEDPNWDYSFYNKVSPNGNVMVALCWYVAMSFDEGNNWDEAGRTPYGYFGYYDILIKDDNKTMYLQSGTYEILKSDDFGDSFQYMGSPPWLHDCSYMGFAATPSYDQIFLTSDGNLGLWVSKNDGIDWTLEAFGTVSLMNVSISSTQKIIVGENGGDVWLGNIGHIKSISGALLGDINKVSRVLIEDLGEISDTYK